MPIRVVTASQREGGLFFSGDCRPQAPSSKKELLLIQTNSPGELTAWVGPILKRLAQKNASVETWIFLTPCQYASGQEAAIAAALPTVTRVFSPKETLRHLLSRTKQPSLPGRVLFLGGDPLYTRLLSLKYGYPAFGYSAHNHSLGWGIRTLKKKDVGDLMAASVQAFLDQSADQSTSTGSGTGPQTPSITFFSGSRPQHFAAYFPIVSRTLWILYQTSPTLELRVQLSPFITPALQSSLLAAHPLPPSAVLIPSDRGLFTLASTTLLVTVPGTNTAEAMYLGIPMIVNIPLNWPHLIIFDGLLGLLGKIPLLGMLLKKAVIAILKRKKRFYALPNMMAEREIIPEYIAHIDSDTLAHHTLEKIQDTPWLSHTSQALRETGHPTWAPADRIIDTMDLLSPH